MPGAFPNILVLPIDGLLSIEVLHSVSWNVWNVCRHSADVRKRLPTSFNVGKHLALSAMFEQVDDIQSKHE